MFVIDFHVKCLHHTQYDNVRRRIRLEEDEGGGGGGGGGCLGKTDDEYITASVDNHIIVKYFFVRSCSASEYTYLFATNARVAWETRA